MTQLGARTFTAPHAGLYDGLNAYYPVDVERIHNVGTKKAPIFKATIRFKEPGPYGYEVGTSVEVSPDWVYPVEMVLWMSTATRTDALPFGLGAEVRKHQWVMKEDEL